MSQGEEQDKSEEATPYKLEQARKKGQVAKSMEINSIMSLLAFSVLMIALFSNISEQIVQSVRKYIIGASSIEVTNESVIYMFLDSSIEMITLFSPLIGALLIVGIGITIMQTKPVFSTEPLRPNFNKLNPVSGLKRIFSMKTLFEFVKTTLKMSAIAALFYLGFSMIIDQVLDIRYVQYQKQSQEWMKLATIVGFAMIVLLIPFALIDLIFSKKEFAKKMRMSKREVKEEVKRRDGDPEVRKKRKQVQNELLKKTSSISNVKDSDVILTNPTHYAVALKYRPHEMIAPLVVAKGSDLLADKIKRVALEHNIPIMRKPALARKIFKESKIDQPILEDNYSEVAPIFRWVFELKGKKV